MKITVATSLLLLLLSPKTTASFQVSKIPTSSSSLSRPTTIQQQQQHQPFSKSIIQRSLSNYNNEINNNNNNNNNEQDNETTAKTTTTMTNRRNFMSSSSAIAAAIMTMAQQPQPAHAGIDVSGLRTEGGGSASGNAALANQLKSYDGSASRRVQEIKSAQTATTTTTTTTPAAIATPEVSKTAATYALRSGGLPSLRSVGLGLTTRYEGYVSGPPQSTKLRQIPVSFEFPSDWLQLDKLTGGIQYVDQRNGDKLYVLRATLPEGTTLSTVPKSFFGEVIFNPTGDIIRGGTVVDSYRVSRAQMIEDCPDGACAPHRRLLLKYETVTGSGVQTVERRGLVDVYEVDGGEVYMLMTSSNAVKFEAKGKERETVENIVNSFRLGI